MPKAVMLRTTCSMACCWTSPPGVPKGMNSLPSRNTIAGAGVNRGRFPGDTSLACPGVNHPCEPRGDTTQPTPGTTGESTDGSLGVAENPFPSASTTHTYDVSRPDAPAIALGAGVSARAPLRSALELSGSPGG